MPASKTCFLRVTGVARLTLHAARVTYAKASPSTAVPCQTPWKRPYGFQDKVQTLGGCSRPPSSQPSPCPSLGQPQPFPEQSGRLCQASRPFFPTTTCWPGMRLPWDPRHISQATPCSPRCRHQPSLRPSHTLASVLLRPRNWTCFPYSSQDTSVHMSPQITSSLLARAMSQ